MGKLVDLVESTLNEAKTNLDFSKDELSKIVSTLKKLKVDVTVSNKTGVLGEWDDYDGTHTINIEKSNRNVYRKRTKEGFLNYTISGTDEDYPTEHHWSIGLDEDRDILDEMLDKIKKDITV